MSSFGLNMTLPLSFVLVSAVSAAAPSAFAEEKVQGQLTCQDIGSQDNREKLADCENHAIAVEYYSCVEVEGPQKGAILSGHKIVEWDGAIGTILSGDGVTRMSGPTEVYKALDGKITLVFKDGKVVDVHGEGHNQEMLAIGAAAPVNGQSTATLPVGRPSPVGWASSRLTSLYLSDKSFCL